MILFASKHLKNEAGFRQHSPTNKKKHAQRAYKKTNTDKKLLGKSFPSAQLDQPVIRDDKGRLWDNRTDCWDVFCEFDNLTYDPRPKPI